MTSLQLGLIIAGILLVIGVVIYNWWQERRVRGGADARGSGRADRDGASRAGASAPAERVEPTLGESQEPMLTRAGSGSPEPRARGPVDPDEEARAFELPVQVQSRLVEDAPAASVAIATEQAVLAGPSASSGERLMHADAHGAQPDPDIECIVALQPARPVPAGALAAGLHARPGKIGRAHV